MRFFQLTLPLIAALLFGVLGAGINYVPHPGAGELKETLSQWSRIIGGFAVLLSVYSLLRLHCTRIRRQQAGWAYSLFFFAGFLAMLVPCVRNGGEWFWHDQTQDAAFLWMYQHMFGAMGATMFSVLGFFIASAAYRTFRAKTASAAILLIAAIIVMLGRAPIGGLITHYIPDMQEWIMMVPNIAAKRAVMFGVCLGVVATSLKIIFGIERTYLGGGD